MITILKATESRVYEELKRFRGTVDAVEKKAVCEKEDIELDTVPAF